MSQEWGEITDGVTIDLQPGENAECTFHNDELVYVRIKKWTQVPTEELFGFSGDLGIFNLTSGAQTNFTNLTAGDIDVTESLPDGWELDWVQCTGADTSQITNGVTIHAEPGDEIACTFGNKPVSVSYMPFFAVTLMGP